MGFASCIGSEGQVPSIEFVTLVDQYGIRGLGYLAATFVTNRGRVSEILAKVSVVVFVGSGLANKLSTGPRWALSKVV